MTEISLIDIEEQPAAGVRRQVRTSELTTFFDETFTHVMEQLQQAGLTPAGAPFARYRGTPGGVVDVEAGFPVTEPFDGDGDLVGGTLPAARAIEAVHVGAHDTLRKTYAHVEEWAAGQQLQLLDEAWERYEAGPASDTDPATWRTRIVWPIAPPQVEQ